MFDGEYARFKRPALAFVGLGMYLLHGYPFGHTGPTDKSPKDFPKARISED